MPFLKNGDSGGVRTRDFLDENQTSWTTRRRNREIIITFFGYSRKSLINRSRSWRHSIRSRRLDQKDVGRCRSR